MTGMTTHSVMVRINGQSTAWLRASVLLMLVKTVTVTVFSPYNYPERSQEIRHKEGEAITKLTLESVVLTTTLCAKHHPEFPLLPLFPASNLF